MLNCKITLQYYNLRGGDPGGRAYPQAGVEIDFVVETAVRRPSKPPQVVAIEVKRSDRWQREWAKPMLNLAGTGKVEVKRMIGVYCGKRTYRFGDVWVYPVSDFIRLLAAGEFF